ncbi:MAG TPA: response regulator transcription factor [Egibacteraceae bacterium]|nr:response regulator transcription factor [Egibacteraceae bacterium]
MPPAALGDGAASSPGGQGDAGFPARVVLADDSILFREGLALILSKAGFEVVGQAAEPPALLELVARNRPDVAIVDVRMPPTYTNEGLMAGELIRTRHPEVALLVLSHYVEPAHALRVLNMGRGSTGYLLKDRVADVEELADAVRRIARGGTAIDPDVVAQLVSRKRVSNPVDTLTVQERRVLALMAEGRSNQAITNRLRLGSKTVESHVRSIFMKLDLTPHPEDHRRVLAVLAYLAAS